MHICTHTCVCTFYNLYISRPWSYISSPSSHAPARDFPSFTHPIHHHSPSSISIHPFYIYITLLISLLSSSSYQLEDLGTLRRGGAVERKRGQIDSFLISTYHPVNISLPSLSLHFSLTAEDSEFQLRLSFSL